MRKLLASVVIILGMGLGLGVLPAAADPAGIERQASSGLKLTLFPGLARPRDERSVRTFAPSSRRAKALDHLYRDERKESATPSPLFPTEKPAPNLFRLEF